MTIKTNKQMRQEHGIGVLRFAREAGTSTRTVRDTEDEEHPRKLRKETAAKYARAWANFGIDPTEVKEVSEALGIGPRYERPDLDMSGIYQDRNIFAEINRLIERRLEQLRVELEAEVRRLIEREVERRVSEKAAQTVRKK